MIKFQDILFANKRIKPYIYTTTLEKSWFLSDLSDGEVFLKLECQQVMKSFKIRGVFNKIISLSDSERKKGIVTVSSGNHGAAVSFAANLLNIRPARVYVPEVTPMSKRDKIKRYGAELIIRGKDYDEAYEIVQNELSGSETIFIDSSSDNDVIAGQGTIGLEILQEIPDIDIILVPIGGGGVITGISIAAKNINPEIEIIGVQPETCPSMLASMRDKVFYKKYPSKDSVCEALIGGVGEIPYNLANNCIDEIILVKEETIKKAVICLLENDKVLSEPSGAVGVACIMENNDRFKGKKVAIVISGGNIDTKLLKTFMEAENNAR